MTIVIVVLCVLWVAVVGVIFWLRDELKSAHKDLNKTFKHLSNLQVRTNDLQIRTKQLSKENQALLTNYDGLLTSYDEMRKDRDKWQAIARWVPDPQALVDRVDPSKIEKPEHLYIRYPVGVSGYKARHYARRGIETDFDVMLELRPYTWKLRYGTEVEGFVIYAPWSTQVLAVMFVDRPEVTELFNKSIPATLTLDTFDDWFKGEVIRRGH